MHIDTSVTCTTYVQLWVAVYRACSSCSSTVFLSCNLLLSVSV